MKVAVLNYTGTIGKTTIAAHLLSPRMNNAPIFAVESINETAAGNGLAVEEIKGKEFGGLFKKLMLLDDAIIDVGASNIETFLDGMVKFEEAHMEFDYFVVPVINSPRSHKETISMVTMLSDLEVPADKIRIIFNRVESDVSVEFAPILNFAKKSKNCIANPDAAIYENEVFDRLANKKITIGQAMADENDYRTMAREISPDGDAKLKAHYQELHVIKSLSKAVNRQLDEVFNVLFDK